MAESSTTTTTAPAHLSRAAFAGLLTAAIFFGLALVSIFLYGLWRWRRAIVQARQAAVAEPYHVEDMPITILSVRRSIVKPPAYTPSPWAENAEAQKIAVSMLEIKSPGLPGYSVPETMANELRASLSASSSSKDRLLNPSTPPPDLPSIVVTAPLSFHERIPSIPPPLPIVPRDAERAALARYTMPPPTPVCPVTGMPLDLSQRTPPPMYNASMERAQREALRQQRKKGNRKSRWRDTLKSVKSVVSNHSS